MSKLIQPITLLAILAVSVSACQVAVITPPGPIDPIGPPGDDPAAIFARDVEPLLLENCSGCHAVSTATPATFLVGDYYDSVLGYPGLVVAGEPAMSELISKGEHRGPAWNPTEAQAIAAWIDAEESTIMPPPPPPPDALTTSPFPVEPGENRIPLTEVGLPGAELVFVATRISSGMMLRDVFFVAGSTGISISHPRFVVWDAGASTLDSDRFADVNLVVDLGMSGLLTDQHIIAGFPDPGELAIQLDSASTL